MDFFDIFIFNNVKSGLKIILYPQIRNKSVNDQKVYNDL